MQPSTATTRPRGFNLTELLRNLPMDQITTSSATSIVLPPGLDRSGKPYADW